MQVTGAHTRDVMRQVPRVLDLVGLSHKSRMYPNELSGGEQQRGPSRERWSITRRSCSATSRPELGSGQHHRDHGTPAAHQSQGTTVVVATHNQAVVDRMRRRVVRLEDGRITTDEERGYYYLGLGQGQVLRARRCATFAQHRHAAYRHRHRRYHHRPTRTLSLRASGACRRRQSSTGPNRNLGLSPLGCNAGSSRGDRAFPRKRSTNRLGPVRSEEAGVGRASGTHSRLDRHGTADRARCRTSFESGSAIPNKSSRLPRRSAVWPVSTMWFTVRRSSSDCSASALCFAELASGLFWRSSASPAS